MSTWNRVGLFIGFIILVGLSRFWALPANFTAVLALFIFAGGLSLPVTVGLGLSLSALIITDSILGFYEGMTFVYLGYVLLFLVGRGFKHKMLSFLGMPRAVLSGVLGAVLFFIVSNFGVWFATHLYPKTWDGLVTCYVMAVPFFHQTVIATMATLAITNVVSFSLNGVAKKVTL